MIGYKWFDTEGFFWRHHFKSLLPLSMPHIDPRLSHNKAQQLVRDRGVWFLRWETEFDSNKPSDWWHVIKDEPEDTDALSANTRSKVRRGNKKYTVTPIDTLKIKSDFYSIYLQTFASYSTIEKPANYQTFKTAIDGLPKETEFWCISEIDSGKIVGFSENLMRDNACFYLSIWIIPLAKQKYAGYALFYNMNKHYLNEMGCQYVSDGARSISHDTNVHEFLETKFNFRKAYSTLNIEYAQWFGMLVKVMYPVRKIIGKLPTATIKKISIILFQEEIKRSHQKKSNNK